LVNRLSTLAKRPATGHSTSGFFGSGQRKDFITIDKMAESKSSAGSSTEKVKWFFYIEIKVRTHETKLWRLLFVP